MNETMNDFAAAYSAMTDDELLNLARDRESLRPEAALALDTELAKRHFGQTQIQEQAERVRVGQLEDAQRKPLAQSFNGFGTQLYGKRNVEPDGSFVTTLWVVLLWIPLIPLKSFRVKYVEKSNGVVFFGQRWSQSYVKITESRPNLRQVINIYSFMVSFLVAANLLDLMHTKSANFYFALAAVWACIPWAVRRFARSSSGRGRALSQGTSH